MIQDGGKKWKSRGEDLEEGEEDIKSFFISFSFLRAREIGCIPRKEGTKRGSAYGAMNTLLVRTYVH